MICKFCKCNCKKDGLQKNGKQRYKCRACHRRQQVRYAYNAYQPGIDDDIVVLTKEGVGIRGTARILAISANTLLNRILSIAKSIRQPAINKQQIYEVDEIRTFVSHKSNHVWIAYAINRKTKEIASYNVGARTNHTLSTIIQALHLSNAKRIYTDRLRNYKYLIDPKVHSTSLYGTNHIERHNLTLRTHIKLL